MVSAKWTAKPNPDAKRIIAPPESDDYKEWNVDQLKSECTARKLNLPKNIPKAERVEWLLLFDNDKVGLIERIQMQRESRNKRTGKPADDRRSQHCMFRLVNVLFSDGFFAAFMASGDKLSHAELDDGGRKFWEKIASAFNMSNPEYDAVLAHEEMPGLFVGIDPSQAQTHSALKLSRMWRELSSNFAKAVAKAKVSGEHSTNFWDFCSHREDVYYLHLWTEQRNSGREFCSGNFYSDDEVDSTELSAKKHRSKEKPSRGNDTPTEKAMLMLAESVAKLVENDKALAREQATLSKLARIEARLDRVNETLHSLAKEIQRKKHAGEDVEDDLIEQNRNKKRKMDLELKMDELEDQL